jgi:hypothetical protein
MQQASRNVQAAESKSEGPLATIRLVRGASLQAANWVLQAGPGGTSLTIGADPSCEWQIRAAGVPARAFCVLLTEFGLYVRSACQSGVRLNGQPLAADWQLVSSEARIDIGMASLELGPGENTALQPLDDALMSELEDALPSSPAGRTTILSDPDHSGLRRSYAPDLIESNPEPPARRSSHFPWRFSRYSLPDAPSVLGRYARPTNNFWLYLAVCVALGGYAFWIALLD